MIKDINLPELGENITSGTATKIRVQPGDKIEKDQILVELETEKAVVEVPATFGGTVKEILIKEGDEVKVGQTIVKVETDQDAGQEELTAEPAKGEQKPKEETEEEQTEEKPEKEPPKEESSRPTAMTTPKLAKDVAAAPSVRRFAREIGVDITLVPGSGSKGRITIDDVKAYAKSTMTSGGPAASGAPAEARPLPDFSKWGEVERKGMNNIRKKTASHLSYCWQTIPHVTQFDKADITELEKLRKKRSTKERKLTVTPFLLKVMASALKTFPQFNASVDMVNQEIIYKKYIHLGVAVDTENGLLVPVIRDVDKKSIFELADELAETASRARDRKIGLEELQGGSMTLTNLGGIGGTAFTPIVNWPEVAILGVSRGGWEPVFENGQFIPRFKLPLSLSYDHRLVDGADGARFLRWVCEAIEQPFLMELNNH